MLIFARAAWVCRKAQKLHRRYIFCTTKCSQFSRKKLYRKNIFFCPENETFVSFAVKRERVNFQATWSNLTLEMPEILGAERWTLA